MGYSDFPTPARTDTSGSQPVPHRARSIGLGIGLPLIIIAATIALVFTWLPDLPQTVALHWGTQGVDRVGAVNELLISNAILIGIAVVVLFPMVVLLGRSALTRRMFIGLSVGIISLFCGILLTQVLTQRGISDPYTASDPGLGIALSMTISLLLGIAAALLGGADPAQPARDPLPEGTSRLELASSARATWVGEATMRRPWLLIVFSLIPVAIAAAIGFGTRQWWLLLPMVLLAALILGFLSFAVKIDASGLTARNNLGLRVVRIPADEVVATSVTHVEPFAEFGGWGLRTNLAGTTGLVTRSGEAIRIERTGNRNAVITVDDATTAAALLNTVAERARYET